MAKYKIVNGRWIAEGTEKYAPSLTNRSLYDIENNIKLPKLNSTQKNIDATRDQLSSARNNYNNYIQSQLKDMNSKKINVTRDYRDGFELQNELEQAVSQRYGALKKASNTKEAKKMKKEIIKKQNAYNYAQYQKRIKDVENDKIGFIDKLITPITSGIQNYVDFSRLTNTTSQVDEKGNVTYLPTKSNLKYNKVREESGTLGKIYGDVAYNLSQATVAKAIDVVTGSPTGSILYYGNIVDDSIKEAKNKGFDNNESLAYGLSTGIVAGVLDKFVSNLGGLTKVSNKIPTLEQGLDKLIFKLTSNKTASVMLSNIGSEGISEFIEEYVDNSLGYVIDSDNMEKESFLDMLLDTLPDAGYSFLVGGLSGGVSTGITMNSEETKLRKEALDEYKNKLENIQPQSIAEAKYKNDQLNAVDNLYNEMEQIAEEATKKQEEVKQEDKIKNLSDDELETTKKSAELLGYDTKPIEEEQERRKKEREIEKKQDEKFVSDVEKMLLDQTTKEEFNDYWADKFGLKDVDKIISDKKFSSLNDEQLLGLKKSAVLLGYDVDDINSEIQLRKKENRIKQEDLDNFNKETEKMLFEYNDEVTKKTEEYAKMFGLSDNLDKNEKSSYSKQVENSLKQRQTQAKQQIKEAKKVNPNLDTNLAEKQVDNVIRITENLGEKETEKLIDMTIPTTETKKVVNLKDNKKYIDSNRDFENIDNFIETSEKSVSNREFKEIEREDKKRRLGYDNAIEKHKNDPDAVAYLENRRDENLYDVRHTNRNVMEESLRLLDDPEHYYNTTMEEYRQAVENNSLTGKTRMSLLEKFEALMDYYGDFNGKNYNGVISRDISDIYSELGTDPAQELAVRSAWMKNNPRAVPLRTAQTLRQMYNQEAKKHENDSAWLEQNDPRKNPNSPYRLSNTQFNTINYYANELNNIKDKNSVEYKKMKMNLDSYIQNIFGSFTLSSAFKKATTLNVLASTRIWFTNIKGNVWNVPQILIDRVPKVLADKIISTQTGFRTSGISILGDITSGIRGFKNGLSESFYEFKHDISLDKFGNKYIETTPETEFNDLGEKHTTFRFNDNTNVGKLMNKYANIVNFFMNVGDKPFAYMYYEQSFYNQRLNQARINATKEKTNYVYKINENNKTNKYTVSYIDAEGKRNIQSMSKPQYEQFMKESKVQDITESMCDIAEQEALENTFQDENKVTKLALKFKKTLNEAVHFGEFGLGDIVLKFTTTVSNMAKSLYEHSPLETINLIKDIKTLNQNINYAKENNTQIDPKLQHKVASDIGKLMGGMITTTIMASLVSTGLLDVEGKEDDDKKSKFTSNTTGSMPYSIQLGKYNYSLDSGSTFSSILKVGTDIGKFLENGENLIQSFLKGSETFTNEMIDVSFLNNILDLTNTQYSSLIENFTQQLASQPANLIPSFMKDISLFIDGFTERQVYDDNPLKYMYNQIINRTPLRGTEFGLDAKVDSWGELKTIGGDTLASVYNTFISSGTFKRIKSDKVSDEIIRVYTSTTNSDAIPKLSMSQNYFKYNKNQYDLTEDEKNSFMKSYAKYSHKAVDDLINLSVYKNANDNEKLKLLQKAYDYADEMSKKDYITSKGEKYYNFDSKNGIYKTYKKPAFEEIIENNISIEEANYKRKYNNSYKLKTSITDWETYNEIHDDIKEIQETYSKDNGYDFKTRKKAVQLYIRDLKGLTNVQKAMLSKIENSKGDYSNYDKDIKKYIDTLNLSNEEYEYIYKQLGLGGYWGMYWKSK